MIYLITNRNLVSEEKYLERIEFASYNGVNNIILREKDLDDKEFMELYFKIKNRISPNCNLIINSKIKVFKEVKESFLHLPFKEFLNYKKEGYEKIGVSVHSLQEGIEADRRGADYILASHIFPTKCKDGLEPKGVKFIKELTQNVNCKIIALGGINENNYKEVLEAGADGVALMSYFFLAEDLERSISLFLEFPPVPVTG